MRVFQKNWGHLNYTEMSFLQNIFPETLSASQNLEMDTIGQTNNKLWLENRTNGLTSSQAHKIFIRKRNFSTLCKCRLKVGLKNVPKSVKDALNHGKEYESVALEKFHDFLTWKLKENVTIRATSLVEPYLFWLGASPDGLIIENSGPALIEIKCPYSKLALNPRIFND